MKRTFTDPETAREASRKNRIARHRQSLSEMWDTISKNMSTAGPLVPYVVFSYFCKPGELQTLAVIAKDKNDLATESDEDGVTLLLRNVYFGNFTMPREEDVDEIVFNHLDSMRQDRAKRLTWEHEALVNAIDRFLKKPSCEKCNFPMDLVHKPYECMVAKDVVAQLKLEGHSVIADISTITSIKDVILPEPQTLCLSLIVDLSG